MTNLKDIKKDYKRYRVNSRKVYDRATEERYTAMAKYKVELAKNNDKNLEIKVLKAEVAYRKAKANDRAMVERYAAMTKYKVEVAKNNEKNLEIKDLEKEVAYWKAKAKKAANKGSKN
uniref:Uncharacterized protein n=1 Tax=Oryza meridionalis TaxID=40149 RepID=A0A0E0EJU0_9ORYZ